MEISFDVGAKLDIATGKEVTDGFDRLDGLLQKGRPRYLLQSKGVGGLSGTVNTIVEVGSPPVGSVWNVLGYTLVGDTDSTQSTAGTVALYIGDPPNAGGPPTLSQVRVTRLSVPFYGEFSENVQWCTPGDVVFFNLAGITGLTLFVGSVFVAEYHADDILSRVGR